MNEAHINHQDEPGNLDFWTDQVQSGDLKEAINLFIWRWGHPALTLAQAEAIAVKVFDMLIEEPTIDRV